MLEPLRKREYVREVFELDADSMVTVQGEFVFTFRIVNKLKQMGVSCFTAETKWEVKEEMDSERQLG